MNPDIYHGYMCLYCVSVCGWVGGWVGGWVIDTIKLRNINPRHVNPPTKGALEAW